MIKFFRKIRQDLLSEGKTGKYFKYAIGEIVLVVIGILIAMQINSWNNERINKKRSIGYMKSLVEDIKSDIAQYNSNIESYETDIKNNRRLLINDAYKMFEADSILRLINNFFMPNKTSKQTYEKIKNIGLAETLGSETINNAINDYYNVEINYYETLLLWDKEYSTKDYVFWFYNSDFESSSIRDYDSNALPYLTTESKRKADLIELIESIQGRNHLRGAVIRHEHTLKRVQEVKVVAENLVELITNELNL